jgi:hypothetical protein
MLTSARAWLMGRQRQFGSSKRSSALSGVKAKFIVIMNHIPHRKVSTLPVNFNSHSIGQLAPTLAIKNILFYGGAWMVRVA